MNCPRDGAHLSKATIDDIELDACPECAGIWLDYRELKAVCGLSFTEVEQNLRKSLDSDQGEAVPSQRYMPCPRCPEGRLQQIAYTYMLPVRVDRCDQCLGIWVDNHELDAIVAERKRLDEEFSMQRVLAASQTEREASKAQERR